MELCWLAIAARRAMSKPMDEKRYHAIADATLAHCCDQLEDAYDAGSLEDLDLQGGILTITAASGRTYLLTKHAPTCQLWYASPNLGGLHFAFNEDAQRWQLADGRHLYEILCRELAIEEVEVIL